MILSVTTEARVGVLKPEKLGASGEPGSQVETDGMSATSLSWTFWDLLWLTPTMLPLNPNPDTLQGS